ncbi:MAG: polysaccharide biosynthesis tyrosine autokinase [candidate division WOR-3 bacterium]
MSASSTSEERTKAETSAPGLRANTGSEAPALYTYYWDVMVRRSRLMMFVSVGVTAVVFLAAMLQRPEYQATASLLASQEDGSAGKVNLFGSRDGASWSARGPNLANHIEMLRSNTLAALVLKALPESARNLMNRTGLLDPVRVQRLIQVRPVRDADVIRLSVRAPSSELARELAEAYVTTYQEYSLTRSRADISAVRNFVELQLAAVAARLDSAETSLEEFKRCQSVVDITQETRALVERQAQVLVRYQQASALRAGLEQRLAYLKSGLAEYGTEGPVSALAEELAALRTERASLVLAGYATTSPRVEQLDRRLRAADERLRAELGQLADRPAAVDPAQIPRAFERIFDLEPQLAEAQATEAALAEQVRMCNEELAHVPVQERLLARLTRDVEVNRQVYSLLAQRREEARIQEAGRICAIGVVDPPQDGIKTKPNLRNSTIVALLVGLCVSFAVVLTVDRLDNKVRVPEDLERQGGVLLANIPRFVAQVMPPTQVKAATDGDGSSSSVAAAESFRVLRTNIQFATAGRPTRTMLVTSAGAGEGKTTVAANLALVMAQSGKKTLLIDADLRRPRLHALFEIRKKPGLTDATLLGVPLDQAIRPGPVEGLSLLCSGTLPPSPVDFLNSTLFARVLERLAGTYECVVFDSPPVLVSADAAILASRLDAVILVARMGQTDRRALAEAGKVLNQAGAHTIGVVANELRPKPAYGYHRYRYRYYHYRHRGALSPTGAD